MTDRVRPLVVTIFAGLFVIAGVFMIFLGVDANAYFAPGACLLLQALLLWKGYGFKLFERLLVVNQLTAIILIVTLGIGDFLPLPKLSISAAMLLANLLTGGPLTGILSIPLLASLLFSKTLPNWFQSSGVEPGRHDPKGGNRDKASVAGMARAAS